MASRRLREQLDGADWSGASPSMRHNLLETDGTGDHFGNSVAMRRARLPVAVMLQRAMAGATDG